MIAAADVHDEGTFAGSGGIELWEQSWRPDSGSPRAAIALVHGVGEHSGRYASVVGPLTDAGYAVFGFDQRGHGRSPGRRVHIDSWSQYRDDLAAFLGHVAEREPGVPLVLYGHSMGALVVLDYLLGRPAGLAGAIVSGSPLQPAGIGSPALAAVARLLSGVVPRLAVDLGLDVGLISSDPEVLAAYVADPLVTSRATVRWGAESLATVERIKAGMSRIDVPLLVLHGGDDRLNLVGGAQELFDAVPRADKTLRIYPGARHEPHNDVSRTQLAADVVAWLDALTAEPR